LLGNFRFRGLLTLDHRGGFNRRWCWLRLLLCSVRARWARRGRRFIALHEVPREDTLLLAPGAIGVFAAIPFGIFHIRDGDDLAYRKAEVVIVARSVLEDRSNRKRRVGHLAKRPSSEELGGGKENAKIQEGGDDNQVKDCTEVSTSFDTSGMQGY
jgi:hypothetical protein